MLKNNSVAIYIAETDHGDMSYSSLLQKMIEQGDLKNLKIQIFSEFPSQTDKVMSQSWQPDIDPAILASYEWQKNHLCNVPTQEMHRANTDMLDEKLIAMGDLKGRAAMYDQTFEGIKGRFHGQDKISAAEITDYLQEVDNPDSLFF